MAETQPTAEEILEDAKKSSLSDTTRAARQLNVCLYNVKHDAEQAIKDLGAGQRVSGMGLGFGPIGHQAPFDISLYTERLYSSSNQAARYGATEEEIAEAIKLGTTSRW